MKNPTKRLGLAVAVLGLMVGAVGQAKAGLVLNGDFETGTSNSWEIYFGGVYSNVSHSGLYGVVFDTGARGSLGQTISGLTVGDTYTLSFWMKNTGTSPTTDFDVNFGSTQVAQPVIQGPAGVYGSYSYQVTATASSQFLQFYRNAYGVGRFYIDDITLTANPPVSAVPEPSTIALVFTALPMGLGFAWKRRRKAVAGLST